MMNNWKHMRGWSDVLSMSEECSGYRERLWGQYFGRSRWDWDSQPKHCTRKKWEVVVVASEEESDSGILEWLLPARRVTIRGYWSIGFWIIPGPTACSAGSWCSFPNIIPNPQSEIQANAQMLPQVMYLLMMEVQSMWDTRSIWTSAAKEMATLAQYHSMHRIGFLEEEQFWLKECWKRVRGNGRASSREEPHKLRGLTKSWSLCKGTYASVRPCRHTYGN